MFVATYLRFRAQPPNPLHPPPRGRIDVYYSPEEGKFIARDWNGDAVKFDATGGAGGSSAWGDITGTLSAQTDLQSALDGKQTSAAGLTSWAAVTRASGFDTFTATPSSANLRALLTDEAGTGSLYFTGGALGTPASATLTNATGLPIGSVTGLASGVASFLITPTSANLRAIISDETGTGVLYFTGGALGTPASATLTNATGLPVSTGITGLGANVANALAEAVGADSSFVVFNGAGGTPSSLTLTNATGLPVSTGISGLATGIATFLATPSSANLAAAVTNETGSGALLFGNQAVSTGSIVTFTGLTVSASGSTSVSMTTVDGDITLAAGSGSTGSIALSGINATLASISGGVTTITSSSTGSIDNMTIGASGPADGTFSNLTANALSAEVSGSKTAKVGGKIKEFYTDGGNVNTAETDLYSYTTEASLFGANGENVEAVFSGIYVGSAFTKQVKAYFAGTAIFDSGALAVGSNSSWRMEVNLIRVSASVVRYSVAMNTSGASTMVYTSVGELTALTLSATNILKITGTAGAGGSSNDIVAKMGVVNWFPVSA